MTYKDALITQITAAFDGVSREGGVSLREGRVIDDYGYGPNAEGERRRVRLLDRDTRWQDVPDEDLVQYTSSVSFLDAIGFRYYAPAYMTYDLRHFNNGEWEDISDLGWHLNLYDREARMREWALKRVSLFTPMQGSAVCDFLQFVVAYGYELEARKARAAIESHWGQFCHADK